MKCDQYSSEQNFAGRKALVTGGSRGIAADISRVLARRGALVAVNFSAAADGKIGKVNAAQKLVDEIRAEGGEAIAIEQDLMVEGGGRLLVEKTRAAIGAVDTLLLSASVQFHIPFLRQTAQQVADQLRINLHANIEILQAILPDMLVAEYGRILTIGSIQEVAPSPEMPIYSLSKSAMKNLVENLALQSAGQGVVINNIAPGLIETDRNAFRRDDPKAWEAAQKSANPLGRAGQPADVTPLALHLLSPANSFTTGATLYATGGAHLPNAGGLKTQGMVLPLATDNAQRITTTAPVDTKTGV